MICACINAFIIHPLKIRLLDSLWIPKPYWINFAITSKCNMLCLTCNIGKHYLQNPAIATDDLSVDEIKEIFIKNRTFLSNISFIQLTGGEPFLREDLVDIVSVIHAYSPKCFIWIATNGSMPEKVEEDIAEIAKFHKKIGIGISIDGTPQIHDYLRGRKGSFEKAIKTLEKLVHLRSKYPALKISISFTITPLNVTKIFFVYKLSKKYNVDFTFRPINISPIYYKNVDTKMMQYKMKDLKALVKFVDNLIKDKIRAMGLLRALSRIAYYNEVLRYIASQFKGLDFRPAFKCFAPLSSFYLDPKGNVYPCTLLGIKLGNLREKTLGEILFSEDTLKIRNYIRRGLCPPCCVECETFRNIQDNQILLALMLLRYLRYFASR